MKIEGHSILINETPVTDTKQFIQLMDEESNYIEIRAVNSTHIIHARMSSFYQGSSYESFLLVGDRKTLANYTSKRPIVGDLKIEIMLEIPEVPILPGGMFGVPDPITIKVKVFK